YELCQLFLNEFAYFFCSRAIQCLTRGTAPGFYLESTYLRLDSGYGWDANAQFIHAEPQKNGDGRGIRAELTADICPLAMLVSGVDSHRDQAQNRWVESVMLRCKRRVTAVHGECVLRQVICADREEIDFRGKHICHQRCGWNF